MMMHIPFSEKWSASDSVRAEPDFRWQWKAGTILRIGGIHRTTLGECCAAGFGGRFISEAANGAALRQQIGEVVPKRQAAGAIKAIW
jgi:hypothetical protein